MAEAIVTVPLVAVVNRAGEAIRRMADSLTVDPWTLERRRRMAAYRALWAQDGLP